MEISVVTVTCRDLYLVDQMVALRQQTFKNFEWIIVDDLYETRKQEIKDMIGDTLTYQHLPPSKINDYFSSVPALNTALSYARGELIFFMVDYVIPHQDCLGRHWALHKTYPDAYFSGISLEVGISPKEFQKTGATTGRDYRMGLYTHSLFVKKMLNDETFESFMDGAQNWWAGRNDSAPLEALLECNGFDELLDGRHGYQDSDMSQRMMILGYRYLIDTKCSCLEFPHQRVGKPTIRSEEEHQVLSSRLNRERVRDRIYKVNPQFDLRVERGKCQRLLS